MMRLFCLLQLAFFMSALSLSAAEHLPQSTTFIGKQKFQQVSQKAIKERWAKLPMGLRMVKIAKELEGIPYKSYTLEIDNRIESPSVNFEGLDCWTFFETCMCFCKMLETPKANYAPSDLLKEIEHTRYRHGQCNGNYLDRIHYLAEWYSDNKKRKNIQDLTREFPHVEMDNKCREMTLLWKSYRYLKHNPDLRKGMAQHEKRITEMPVYMIPKHKVASIEHQLKDGDIIGIASKYDGGYCSHVGIIVKDAKGKARFMHASTTYKKVVIDDTISNYLYQFKKHAGILVARPL